MTIKGIKILRVGTKSKEPEGIFDIFFGEGWKDWTRVRVKQTGHIEITAGEKRNNELLFSLLKDYLFPQAIQA